MRSPIDPCNTAALERFSVDRPRAAAALMRIKPVRQAGPVARVEHGHSTLSPLVERVPIERPQGVEDDVQWHESTGLRQLAPVRQVLHRTGIRSP